MSREWFEDPVVLKLKRYALKGGNNGIRDLIRGFNSFNTDNDAKLTKEELDVGLKGRGINLTGQELTHLVCAFDRDGDGYLSLPEFVAGFTSMLPARRREVIKRSFESLGPDERGNVPLDTVVNAYRATHHPLVRRGELSLAEAEENFRMYFTPEYNPDGQVSIVDFMGYYSGVSSNVPDDEYFEDLLCSVWDLEDPENPPSFSLRTATGSFSSVTKPVLQEKIPSHHRKAVASKTLQNCYAHPLNSRNYDSSGTQSKRGLNQTFVDHMPRHSVLPTYQSTYALSFPPTLSNASRKLAQPAARALVDDPPPNPLASTQELHQCGDPILDAVRAKIFHRGGKGGFRGLTRVLRIMDDNGNKRLDKFELQNGLQAYGLKMTKEEMGDLWVAIDRSGDHQVNITEFLRFLTGPMSEGRTELVLQAYSLLDLNGDESVHFDELKKLYDVKNHPEVLSKEKTPQNVLAEFTSGWDKNDDGVITFREFEDYYTDISAGIDNDQYFELMMRNAWHISGGQGAAANTSCRRVLVVHTDGSQTVEEIKNDLGIGPDDMDAMRANLASQGITDVKKISLTY